MLIRSSYVSLQKFMVRTLLAGCLCWAVYWCFVLCVTSQSCISKHRTIKVSKEACCRLQLLSFFG
jgi:hypothetical protein